MFHFQFVRGHDWVGVYLNGELKAEGHTISPSTILSILAEAGIEIKSESIAADNDWLNDRGYLPHSISEVVKEK